MKICVDFDGTIVDHCYPAIGKPVPLAIFWMKRWIELDAKLILFTLRSDDKGFFDSKGLSAAVGYLKENGIELYGVNVDPDQKYWSSSPKVHGEYYVDNAAVGCPLIHPEGFERPCVDWAVVGPFIEKELLREGKT